MRRVVWFLSAALVPLLPSLAFGQAPLRPTTPVPAQTSSPVALVDVVKVFENHARFKQQMDAIRAEIQSFEREMQQQQESIGRDSEQLQTAQSDLQKSQLEARLARQAADMQVKGSLKRNEILDREAKIYYETYNEVAAEVARLANQYNISLVLRYDSGEINPLDRNSVLKGVNRPIVMQRNLDLTQMVIKRFSGNDTVGGVRPKVNPDMTRMIAPMERERSIGNRLPFSGRTN